MPSVESLVNFITFMELTIIRLDEFNLQVAKLEAERESAMKAERATVLVKMKADIKLYGFKTSDFKGTLQTRAKRGTKVKTNLSSESKTCQHKEG